jgi:hypothetical protein
MSNTLSNRTHCMRELGFLTDQDIWVARYALLAALSRLDLGALNEVLELVEALERRPVATDGLLAKVLNERFNT